MKQLTLLVLIVAILCVCCSFTMPGYNTIFTTHNTASTLPFFQGKSLSNFTVKIDNVVHPYDATLKANTITAKDKASHVPETTIFINSSYNWEHIPAGSYGQDVVRVTYGGVSCSGKITAFKSRAGSRLSFSGSTPDRKAITIDFSVI